MKAKTLLSGIAAAYTVGVIAMLGTLIAASIDRGHGPTHTELPVVLRRLFGWPVTVPKYLATH